MLWRIISAIGIGIVLALAILILMMEQRPNVANRAAFAATSDPTLAQERHNLEVARLRKANELTLMEMSNEAQLRVEKARILQQQRIRNEINFANMVDFFRWAFVASLALIVLIGGGLWALRLITSIDNILYSFIFAPTRIATIDRRARLIARENTPLLSSPDEENDEEPSGTRSERAGNHGTRPATVREGRQTRMRRTVDLPELEVVTDEPTIQVCDLTLTHAEYLQFSHALDHSGESKSAIAKRLTGRYQTNLRKLNAIIDHRNRYERTG